MLTFEFLEFIAWWIGSFCILQGKTGGGGV